MKKLIASFAALAAATTAHVAPTADAKTADPNPFAVHTIDSLRQLSETDRQFYIGGIVQTIAVIEGTLDGRSDVANCIAGSGVMVDQIVRDAADTFKDDKVTEIASLFAAECKKDPSVFEGRAMMAETDAPNMFGANAAAQHRGYFILGAIDTLTVRAAANIDSKTAKCVRDLTMPLLDPKSEESAWLVEKSEGPLFDTLIEASIGICTS